ncbi:MAG: hypothetical protein NW201_02945 [Gemmatimonadales bacterium]|nr:hypothetical protein [Gemmatimonadales bacterium]
MRVSSLVLAALLAIVPASASAQLGGLVKKAVGDRARQQLPAPARGGNGQVAITDDVLDRFTAGLRVGAAEREKPSGSGPYARHQAALGAWRQRVTECQAPQRRAIERLNAAAAANDQKAWDAAQQEQVRQPTRDCYGVRPAEPDGYWDDKQRAEQALEQKMAAAADMSVAEFAMVKEPVEPIVRGRKPAADAPLAPEQRLIADRYDTLRPLFLAAFRADDGGELPQLPPVAPRPVTAEDRARMASAKASSDCLQNSPDLQRLQKQIEAAQKSGNTEQLMMLGMQYSQASAKCTGGPAMGDDEEAEQPKEADAATKANAACLARQPGYVQVSMQLDEAKEKGDQAAVARLTKQMDAMAAKCGAPSPAAPGAAPARRPVGRRGS